MTLEIGRSYLRYHFWFAVVALVALVPPTLKAETDLMDPLMLYEECQKASSQCIGYLQAVADIGWRPTGHCIDMSSEIPASVEPMREALLAWFSNSPEISGRSAYDCVIAALVARYPCEKK